MIYKEFQGMKLSQLGFGAMRLPVIDGDDAKVDEAATEQMVDRAMAKDFSWHNSARQYEEMYNWLIGE